MAPLLLPQRSQLAWYGTGTGAGDDTPVPSGQATNYHSKVGKNDTVLF